MKWTPLHTPRKFKAGTEPQVEISDCGHMELGSDEQITFVTPSGKQYDVARKSWGFYATPSVNGRLAQQGFKTALVKNAQGRIYVMLVEQDQKGAFEAYLQKEKAVLEEWLDER